jgi:hypothetical protein
VFRMDGWRICSIDCREDDDDEKNVSTFTLSSLIYQVGAPHAGDYQQELFLRVAAQLSQVLGVTKWRGERPNHTTRRLVR